MSNAKPILQPCMECPWNSQSRDDLTFWEFGGQVENPKGHQMAYALVAPAHIPVVTVGLRSAECAKGFDYLLIRVGALDAYNLKLDPNRTVLIFVQESQTWTTRAHLSFLAWSGTALAFSSLIQAMAREVTIQSIADVRGYVKSNVSRDFQSLAPLKPYQKHVHEFAGLKLGVFLDDHEEANPKVIAAFEKMAGCSLPEDYREFLLKTNGGQVKNRVSFQANGLKKPRWIRDFRRFRRKPSDFENPRAYFASAVPGLLQIAHDDKSDGIYIGIGPGVLGKVVSISQASGFWHSRDPSLESRLKLRGVRLLGDSFSTFLDSLTIRDELW